MFDFCVGSICPGRHLAANSVSNSDIQDEIMFNLEQIVASIMISNIIAVFKIEKAIGLEGEPIEPKVEYLGLIR